MAVDGTEPAADQKPLPPGVVLGKDGKPCRTCSSGAAFAAFASKAKASPSPSPSSSSSSSGALPAAAAAATAAASTFTPRKDCPPDVEELGRSTWTLLHSMAAAYPARASAREQADLRAFLGLFARLYPCWSCAADFERYLQTERPPDAPGRAALAGRAEFGRWLCDAHNAVNRKLGKPAFDCARWEERWRDGWKDGRCD